MKEFRYIDLDKELNISKENIGKIIQSALHEGDFGTCGRETYEYIDFVCRRMAEDYNISEEAQDKLLDYGCAIAQTASMVAYHKGFKEGVRLFRTLMNL